MSSLAWTAISVALTLVLGLAVLWLVDSWLPPRSGDGPNADQD